MLTDNLNHDMYRRKAKIGLIIVVTSCYIFIIYLTIGKEKLKNTVRKLVTCFKELAAWGREEKETVRLIRLLVAIVTTVLPKWYIIPLSYWIVNSTRVLGESVAAVLPVVVVDNMLKLGYIVYTIIVEPISFFTYQIAGAGGGLVMIIGSGVLQLQKLVLNPVTKGNPFFFYNLYRAKLLLIRGIAIIVYSVSAALESILKIFLIIYIVISAARGSRRGEPLWQSFKEKVIKPKSLEAKNWILVEDPYLRCKRICLVILPFFLYCLRFKAKPALKT